MSQNCYISPIPFRCDDNSALSPPHHQGNLEMDWNAVLTQDWRRAWRPGLCEFQDAFKGQVRSKLDKYLVVVNLEVGNPKAVELMAVDRKQGMTGAETSFIGQLGILNAYRIEFNKVPPN
jgi:hypothetical protein